MKSFGIMLSLLMLSSSYVMAQQSDKSAVKQAVINFAKGGDDRNVSLLESVLHKDYRTVLHRAFGGDKTAILDKSTYITMVKNEKIGGIPRKVKVKAIQIAGNVATAKAIMESDKLKFISFYSLVKTPTGQWQLVGDVPHVEKKS